MKNTNKLKPSFFYKLNLKGFLIILLSAFIQYPFNFKVFSYLKAEEIGVEYLKKNIKENDYILGIGDVIQISISPKTMELTNNYKIDAAGTIYLPKIGRVYIKELTISELNKVLKERYYEYIRDPQPEVMVVGYRPVRILIEGEIENPGLYTLPGSFKNSINNGIESKLQILELDTETVPQVESKWNNKLTNTSTNYFPTVFDALQYAGGVTAYSNLFSIKIIRKDTVSNGGGRKQTEINFLSFINGSDPEQNIRLYDGDTIKIKKSDKQLMGQLSKAIQSNLNPKFLKVSVTGTVNSPGIKNISKKSTLNDAIQMAGGLKPLKGPIYFTRFNEDGSVDSRKISYRRGRERGTFQNPYLKNGDIINVGRSNISVVNEVLKEITGPIIPIYSTYKIFN